MRSYSGRARVLTARAARPRCSSELPMTDSSFATRFEAIEAAFAFVTATMHGLSPTTKATLLSEFTAAHQSGDPRRERRVVLDILSGQVWSWLHFDRWLASVLGGRPVASHVDRCSRGKPRAKSGPDEHCSLRPSAAHAGFNSVSSARRYEARLRRDDEETGLGLPLLRLSSRARNRHRHAPWGDYGRLAHIAALLSRGPNDDRYKATHLAPFHSGGRHV